MAVRSDELRALKGAIAAARNGAVFAHESWLRLDAKVEALEQKAKEIVVQQLPRLQADYDAAWNAHLEADGTVKQAEDRYRRAIAKQMEALKSSGKGEGEQRVLRESLEANKAEVLKDRQDRADFNKASQEAVYPPRP